MAQTHYKQGTFDLCAVVDSEAQHLSRVNGLKIKKEIYFYMLNVDVSLQLQLKCFLCQRIRNYFSNKTASTILILLIQCVSAMVLTSHC